MARLSDAQLKLEIDRVKADLKNRHSYESATNRILELAQEYLTRSSKTYFYNCLNILSYRVGTTGFEAKVVQPLFNYCADKPSAWSPTFKENIKRWNGVINDMVAGSFTLGEVAARDKGRFGTSPSSRPRAYRAAQRPMSVFSGTHASVMELMLNNLLMGRSYLSDSDASSDEEDPYGTAALRYTPRGFYSSPPQPRTGKPFHYFLDEKEDEYILKGFQLPHKSDLSSVKKVFGLTQDNIDGFANGDRVHLVVISKSKSVGVAPPKAVAYKLNNEPIGLPQTFKDATVQFGLDISDLCRVGQNTLLLTSASCCCSFEFSVRRVRSRSVDSLVKEIAEKGVVSGSELTLAACRNNLKQKFGDVFDGDIVTEHIGLSLLCPLSQSPIIHPMRGRNCVHAQCVDLRSFLLMMEDSNQWKCPVCNRSLAYEEICIDPFFKDIAKEVEKSGKSARAVRVLPSLEWETIEDAGCHSDSEDDADEEAYLDSILNGSIGSVVDSDADAHDLDGNPLRGSKRRTKAVLEAGGSKRPRIGETIGDIEVIDLTLD